MRGIIYRNAVNISKLALSYKHHFIPQLQPTNFQIKINGLSVSPKCLSLILGTSYVCKTVISCKLTITTIISSDKTFWLRLGLESQGVKVFIGMIAAFIVSHVVCSLQIISCSWLDSIGLILYDLIAKTNPQNCFQ